MKQEPQTVLVVDDDAGIRKMIANLLRSRGFGVLEARNGLEAVQVYGSYHSRIALVITDLEMPVMGGPEAVARMQSIDSRIRVLIVSGCVRESAPAGECARLGKPFTAGELLDCVQRALNAAGGLPG